MNSCLINRFINIPGLAICIFWGTFSLWAHNNLLYYIYLIFALCVIIAHASLYCSRCVNYGKDCYILGGLLSRQLFKKRHQGSNETDDAIMASLWILLAVFPIPFLLYYQDYLLAAVCLLLFWGWFYLHKQTACSKCENIWCGLNKRRN
jgi:hypothetical protein